MKLITRDDIIESLVFFRLIGWKKILSKLHINPARRAANKFQDGHHLPVNTNWWIIPSVKKRLNEKITGDPDLTYEPYVSEKYLQSRSPESMLSLGSGVCSHELIFAELNPSMRVTCLDISESSLDIARKNAEKRNIKNISFETTDVNNWNWSDKKYDIILFHSSLHHFKNIDHILRSVKSSLGKNGILIIYEFVGPPRLAWRNTQLKTANNFLKKIPKNLRRYPVKGMVKKSISGPGLIRMLLMDPSEAVESHLIRDGLNKYFQVLEEIELGANLLTLIFKGIAHHFCDTENAETHQILEEAFKLEDTFISKQPSDLLFGVYCDKQAAN